MTSLQRPKVPFLDLRASYLELKASIDISIADSLDSGSYILGSGLTRFESSFAHYCGSDAAIGVANGLDALILSLLALDIGPGDEVIVPSHTFIATWLAVSHVGATIIPVECDFDTFNINTTMFEIAITSKTKAVIPVALYGLPCDLSEIRRIANHYGLFIVQDAAQAHGARYLDQPIGKYADLTCWSFYPGKNLGCFGDGGCITTNNHSLALKLNALRNYGSHEKYHNKYIGFNSRLDPIQASILSIKLNQLDEWNRRRQSIADHYLSSLDAFQSSLFQLPNPFVATSHHVWHLFVIKSPYRDLIQKRLMEFGIQTLIHYPIPPSEQQCYFNIIPTEHRCQSAITLSSQVLSLPIGPHMTPNQVDYVVSSLSSILTTENAFL